MKKKKHHVHHFFLWLFIIIALVLAGVIFAKPALQAASPVIDVITNTTPKKVDNNKGTSFIIAGDVMLARAVNATFPDEKLDELATSLPVDFFTNHDLAMANLEGPISTIAIAPDITDLSMIFNFSPYTAKFLRNLHLNAVSLANNHTNNQGAEGLAATVSNLDDQNIIHVGQPQGISDNSVQRFGTKPNQISVIAANFVDSTGDITALISNEKKSGNFVIIYPHWGIEYAPTHSVSQQNLTHSWIDTGADLVVGSHPHVIEDAEVYKNKPIFYSLGNFIFDQNFSTETQTGLVIDGKFTKSQLTLNLIPIKIDHYKPTLMTGVDPLKIINQLRIGMRFQPVTDASTSKLIFLR